MDFLHRGIGIPLLHPMIEDGFQVGSSDVPHDSLPNQRKHLVLRCAFQPVVCCPLHRGEFENLEPAGHTLLDGLLRFVRVTHLCVELGDVGSNLLLCLCFRLAGEHLAALDTLLIKVPDDALPSSVCSTKDIAVGGESFLWHGAAPFLNHQHYRTAFAYVQTYVFRFVEKSLPAFWWFYLYRQAGKFLRPYSLFMRRKF